MSTNLSFFYQTSIHYFLNYYKSNSTLMFFFFKRFFKISLVQSPTVKLSDRSCVYAPNSTPGAKPITWGHQYSVLANLPEGNSQERKHWILPVSCERIKTTENYIFQYILHRNTDNSFLKLGMFLLFVKFFSNSDGHFKQNRQKTFQIYWKI